MNRLSKSFSQYFDRLTYSRKFSLITLVFVIPVIAFIPLITNQISNIRQYGVSELSGTLYLRSLWKLSEDIQDYINVAHQYSDGDIPFTEVQAIESKVESSLNAFYLIHLQYGETLDPQNNAEKIRVLWSNTKGAVQSSDWETFASLQPLLFQSISTLTVEIGDSSYLILDPTLDTYYMMDTVLIKEPDIQALTFETNQVAERAIVHGSLSIVERTQLITLIGRLEADLAAMERNINTAIQNDPTGEIAGLVTSPLDDYKQKLQTYISFINNTLVNATPSQSADLERDLRELRTIYENLHRSDSSLYNAASTSLEIGIKYRINRLSSRLLFSSVIALVSILVAFMIGLSMMSSISQPLADLLAATKKLASGEMNTRVPVNVSGELGQVGVAFNQMAEELERDKAVLLERSNELAAAHAQSERRALQLQNIGEISRILSSEQNLDVLLPLIANIVSEKFNFYHVGFFLLDEQREYAVLQAANSLGGKRMLERRHKLRVGQVGIVGFVAATKKPRIALNVGDDAIYFNNPDLPETRSELALPIQIGNEMIGILDVQSTEPNAFNEEYADILATLADQIAIGIQNARSYKTTQELLEEAQRTSKQFLSESWRTLQEEQTQFGYHITKDELKPIHRPEISGHIRKAIADKATVVESEDTASLTVPIWLRNEVIGVVDIRVPEEHEWDSDEVDIVEAVADRLSLAIESSLLLQTTQRRAEFERITADISGKIGATTHFDSILRTAAEELSRVLGSSEVLVQIQPLDSFENQGKS